MNIGPYAVIKELGHGGMGVVYEASDSTDGRTVAIKMVQSYAALDWRGRIGLVREARIAGQLCHPSIIRVYDIGQYKGWLYLVMEYLQGASLDRVSRSGDALPIQRKLQILIQLCDALNYAHTFGVVHRDVKPANIFILSDGTVKVVDFGLATQVTVHDDQRFAGTIPYMSPEQVSRGEVDGRSDIWSAGVTMYELLTGKLPFRGATATEVCDQIMHGRVPAVDHSTPLADEFDLALERALARNKQARYSTAGAFAEDLRRLEVLLKSTEVHTSDSNREAQLRIDSEEKKSSSTSKSQQSTVVGYQQLDVGFRRRSVDAVEVRSGEFRLSKPQRWLEEYWGPAIFVALFTVAVLFDFKVSLDTLRRLIVYVVLPELLLWRALIYLLRGASILAKHPRCRSCSLAMSRTSGWTKSVKTNAEVVLGYQDCIAALQENLWQDAAKLLSIHGAEPSTLATNKLISTPLRYHLEFYECRTCSHHAARLTTDDLVDDEWQSRIKFTEAYQGTTVGSVSILARLRTMPSRFADIVLASVRNADPIRIDKRLVGGLIFVFVIIGALLFQGWRAEKARERYETLWEPSGVEATNARNAGLAYYYGKQVSTDRLVAARYFAHAATNGDGFSANMLGQMYENADGLTRDYAKAAAWYRVASQEGNSDGPANLGRMCEQGIGVEKDLHQAVIWYEMAAKAGNQAAKDQLATLRSKQFPPMPVELMRRVQPVYPPLAYQARVQGVVVLKAVIAKDGTVQSLELESGHPMLVKAAIDAVKQWRFKPYMVDGVPVEVQTKIRVNFPLEGVTH